jgi:uncharacterized cupredoxin-like copper-binding protein
MNSTEEIQLKSKTSYLVKSLALCLVLCFGFRAEARKVRTISLEMNDSLKFVPDKIAVKKGETIKFVLKNTGQVRHEMVFGTPAELKEHAEMMRTMPTMKHAGKNQVTAEPGKTVELVSSFPKAGEFEFACLEPGHLESGMSGKVTVK